MLRRCLLAAAAAAVLAASTALPSPAAAQGILPQNMAVTVVSSAPPTGRYTTTVTWISNDISVTGWDASFWSTTTDCAAPPDAPIRWPTSTRLVRHTLDQAGTNSRSNCYAIRAITPSGPEPWVIDHTVTFGTLDMAIQGLALPGVAVRQPGAHNWWNAFTAIGTQRVLTAEGCTVSGSWPVFGLEATAARGQVKPCDLVIDAVHRYRILIAFTPIVADGIADDSALDSLDDAKFLVTDMGTENLALVLLLFGVLFTFSLGIILLIVALARVRHRLRQLTQQ